MKGLGAILFGGVLFGFGLALSGLAYQETVLSFLQLKDLGLALMMGAALAVATPVYQLAPRLFGRPPVGRVYERMPRQVTRDNVAGAVLFGVGWGISGICPGAAIASLGTGNVPILLAILGMLLGAHLQGVVTERKRRAGGSAARPSTPGADT